MIESYVSTALAGRGAYPDDRARQVADQRRRERTSKLPIHTPIAADLELLRSIAARRTTLAAEKQCIELLDALRKLQGGASVSDLEDGLCIGHAPRRIADLREIGHTIASEPALQADAMGRLRKTCVYRLLVEAGAPGRPGAIA